MNTLRIRLIPALSAALVVATATIASAQTTVVSSTTPPGDIAARQKGDREFTLGGNGSVNQDFDSSFGGVNFSVGQYTSPQQEVVFRQTINYSNPDNAKQQWSGSTRLAFDHHFVTQSTFRPFIGANLGGTYGQNVRDTWTGGLEAGGKFYVQPRTFMFLLIDYSWFFRHANDIDTAFSDGQYSWSVGLGFNF